MRSSFASLFGRLMIPVCSFFIIFFKAISAAVIIVPQPVLCFGISPLSGTQDVRYCCIFQWFWLRKCSVIHFLGKPWILTENIQQLSR